MEQMNWYTIRTQNNKEKSVLEKLQNEVKFSKLDSKLGRCIIPTEKVLSVKNGKKVFKEKTLYPGYIFVETSAKGEIANLLKNVNGSSGFVRTRSGEVIPMKDYEVKKILVEQEESDNLDLSLVFAVGERVEISEGPFQSFKGTIDSIDVQREKVRVIVTIFGRETVVDLTLMQISKTDE